MSTAIRYIALGSAFLALTGATIIHTVPQVEADVLRQTSQVTENVKNMAVTVNGRDVQLLGRLRTAHPDQITPAVLDLIKALDDLPAVNRVDAAVDLLNADHSFKLNAAEPATVIRT